ncbi:MAG: magnesium transporter MgtE N-terminal domain-containing protein [Terriglobales bacterium]
MGTPVLDSSGTVGGRVCEVAVHPQAHAARVAGFVISTPKGQRMVPFESIEVMAGRSMRASTPASDWPPFSGGEGMLLLERDLLDQQIIDVHGRKVVRVNDVDLQQEFVNNVVSMRVFEVDVGPRGAVRRLLRGLVPSRALEALLLRIPPRVIPWEFVDLIETDPARRIKLKIAHERLAKLHPADIADIIEELSPAEREAVFETLDEEVAAGALEEVDPKLQVSIVESLDSDRAADIVEEMDPDAAANLLGDLSEETSEEILGEMEPEEREEVTELLEFKENTAAGHMTTDYIALASGATVADAIRALREFEGSIESFSTIFLVDAREKLTGVVPLARLVLAPDHTPLATLSVDTLVSCSAGARETDAAELFDKYNLLTLPVVDKEGRLTGVITADDIISLLRRNL